MTYNSKIISTFRAVCMAAFCVFAFVACQDTDNENYYDKPTDTSNSITVNIADNIEFLSDTRTAIGDNNRVSGWEVGDAISITYIFTDGNDNIIPPRTDSDGTVYGRTQTFTCTKATESGNTAQWSCFPLTLNIPITASKITKIKTTYISSATDIKGEKEWMINNGLTHEFKGESPIEHTSHSTERDEATGLLSVIYTPFGNKGIEFGKDTHLKITLTQFKRESSVLLLNNAIPGSTIELDYKDEGDDNSMKTIYTVPLSHSITTPLRYYVHSNLFNKRLIVSMTYNDETGTHINKFDEFINISGLNNIYRMDLNMPESTSIISTDGGQNFFLNTAPSEKLTLDAITTKYPAITKYSINNISDESSIDFSALKTAFGDCYTNYLRTYSISLPEYTGSIPDNAFQDFLAINSFNAPKATGGIGNGAFKGSTNLVRVSMLTMKGDIGDDAFYDCLLLSLASLPNIDGNIGSNAFYKCNNLSAVNVHSVKGNIGNYAFSECKFLRGINLPNMAGDIGNDAFSECNILEEINLPNMAGTINDNAFYNCTSLQKITLGGTGDITLTDNSFENFGKEGSDNNISSGCDLVINENKKYESGTAFPKVQSDGTSWGQYILNWGDIFYIKWKSITYITKIP